MAPLSTPKKTFIAQVSGPRGGTDTRTGARVSAWLSDWSDGSNPDAVHIHLEAEFQPDSETGELFPQVRIYSSDRSGRHRTLWSGPLEAARPGEPVQPDIGREDEP